MKVPVKETVRHYGGYYALYVGHVARYVVSGHFFDAVRSAALAEGALELATDCLIPDGWNGFDENDATKKDAAS